MTRHELERQLRGVKLGLVRSSAVRRLGYDPQSRMAVVQFTGGDRVYGYPNLSDDEIAGLLHVMQDEGSLGEYISGVIKRGHDHEVVSYSP